MEINHTLKASSEGYGGLSAIGLTKTQARCYGLLSTVYGLSAGELAKRLGVSRTNIYPLLKDLHTKGFLAELRITAPTTYKAIPLTHALEAYADYQRHKVRQLIILQQQIE